MNCKAWLLEQNTARCFAFKPRHLQISSNGCARVTQPFIIMLKLQPMVCFPMKNGITMNSDCGDSPSKLAVFLFYARDMLPATKARLRTFIWLSFAKVGSPTRSPSPLEKDLITAAKSTHECGNVLRGVGEICVAS